MPDVEAGRPSNLIAFTPMVPKEAPCATKVNGGVCSNLVHTFLADPEKQNWLYCDDCYEQRKRDGNVEDLGAITG